MQEPLARIQYKWLSHSLLHDVKFSCQYDKCSWKAVTNTTQQLFFLFFFLKKILQFFHHKKPTKRYICYSWIEYFMSWRNSLKLKNRASLKVPNIARDWLSPRVTTGNVDVRKYGWKIFIPNGLSFCHFHAPHVGVAETVAIASVSIFCGGGGVRPEHTSAGGCGYWHFSQGSSLPPVTRRHPLLWGWYAEPRPWETLSESLLHS